LDFKTGWISIRSFFILLREVTKDDVAVTNQKELLLMDNMQTNTENEYLKLAIDTIRLNVINEKVSTVRRSLENKPEKAIVRSLYRTSLRVAAILLLIVGSATVYKYISTNDRSIYDKQFLSFELTNTRGAQNRESETEAYRSGNWNEAIKIYSSGNDKSNKNTFLAATSYMQLNHFQEAVTLFEELLYTKSDDHSFQEETEYYLSLAYLMNHQDLKSMQLINKIKADPNHTYYPLAVKISDIDMKIITLKNK
jgi:tetratricopeptide (TPR) repeat protein